MSVIQNINNVNFNVSLDYAVYNVTIGALTTRVATLPAINQGSEVSLKIDSSSGAGAQLSIVPANGETIEGLSSITLGGLLSFNCVRLMGNGSKWMIMAKA